MLPSPHPFPILRWFSLIWMAVWLPSNLYYWGVANLMHLCDVGIVLAFIGIWLASPVILSSQAIAAISAGFLWALDVGSRLGVGRHLVGGTEYMWDTQYPLWVRLLSTFHIGLPFVLLWTLRKVGYDPRSLVLQSAIAAVLLVISRFLSPQLNMNYAFTDPVWHRAWGPVPIHLALTLLVIVAVIYWPTHALLALLFRSSGTAKSI